MSEPNPYAPPASDGQEPPPKKTAGKRKTASKELVVWRVRDCVVMATEGVRLPKRCVVCNAPMDGDRVLRQFSWHPPWVYGLMLCGWLPYLIFASSTRKGARVEVGLCARHQERRRNGLILAWAGGAVGLLFLIVGSTSNVTPLIWAGLLMLIALPITGGRMARVARVDHIDSELLWLKVGEPFLASIPERNG